MSKNTKLLKLLALVLAAVLVTGLAVPFVGAEDTGEPVPAEFVAVSTDLDGRIGLNFYISLPEYILNDSGAYITFTHNDDTEYAEKQVISRVIGEPVVINDCVCYKFTHRTVAKKMLDVVTVNIYSGSGEQVKLSYYGTQYDGLSYSFSQYLDAYTGGDPQGSAAMQTLAAAMTDYCNAARLYFGYEAADAWLSEALSTVRMEHLVPYAAVKEGTLPAGIEGLTMSLSLDADNSVNIIYALGNGAEAKDYQFTVDGTDATPKAEGSTLKVKLPGIAARELGYPHKFAVTDGDATYTVTVSALTYCLSAIAAPDGALANLAKALYLYNKAALGYFGSYVSPRTGRVFSQCKFVDSEDQLIAVNEILDEIIPEDLPTLLESEEYDKYKEMDEVFFMDESEQIFKIVAVHDWMVGNIRYDVDDMEADENQYIGSALAGETVCAGYAKLFYVFMEELGIECSYITGFAYSGDNPEPHAWDAVKMGDGWYYVDVTWDDPVLNGHSDYPDLENLSCTYLLRGSREIQFDHDPEIALPEPEGGNPSYNFIAHEFAALDRLRMIRQGIDGGILTDSFILDENPYSEEIEWTVKSMVESLEYGHDESNYKVTVYLNTPCQYHVTTEEERFSNFVQPLIQNIYYWIQSTGAQGIGPEIYIYSTGLIDRVEINIVRTDEGS